MLSSEMTWTERSLFNCLMKLHQLYKFVLIIESFHYFYDIIDHGMLWELIFFLFSRFNISKADYKRYYNDYVHLYIDTVYSVIKEEDTSRPFVPSSPSNGLDTIAEGWVAKDPQSTRYGDSELFYLLTCFYLATFFIISLNSSHSGALKTTPVPEPSSTKVNKDWSIQYN